MPDYGAMFAEKAISGVDRRLRSQYKTAERELLKKLASFIENNRQKDAEMRQKVEEGKITKAQYQRWVKGQIFQQRQWESKVEQIKETLLLHNRQSAKIVHDKKLEVFVKNYNDGAKEAAENTGVSFKLYSTESAARLIRRNPQILPKWNIDEEKDYKWNQKKVNNCVLQGIIQGKSVDGITKSLVKSLCTMNRNKMRTFARTAITGAQNAGRMEMMHNAQHMGIEIRKKWLATLDKRTRDTHRHLDGQEKGVDEPFESDLGEIMYPGDPTANPANVYNCRCTLTYVYPKVADLVTEGERISKLDGQSYKDWKEGKKPDSEEKQKDKTTGSAFGIIAKTNRYNEQEHRNDEKIRKLDEEYSKLYTESLLKYGTEEYDSIERRMKQIEEETARLREISVEIQADRSRFLAESGEKEIKKLYGAVRGKHNAAIDAKAVNTITADPRTQSNCASCALAYDARRRGIDSVARLSYATNNSEIETWWQGLKLRTTGKYWGTDAREELRSIASQWGEGARGIVQVDWSDLEGHTFVFEVVHGRCMFIDPQTGTINADELFVGARPGSVRYARTDDKVLTKAALFGMRGRRK